MKGRRDFPRNRSGRIRRIEDDVLILRRRVRVLLLLVFVLLLVSLFPETTRYVRFAALGLGGLFLVLLLISFIIEVVQRLKRARLKAEEAGVEGDAGDVPLKANST